MPHTDQRVALITGAAQGIGAAIADELASDGMLVVVADVNQEGAEAVAARNGGVAKVLDVSDPERVAAVIAEVVEQFGRIDVLVNNAGYGYVSAIEEGQDDQVRQQFETNVFGLIGLIKAVLPGMRARRSGHIVNFSSIGGLVGFAATGYYHATKFAVEGLSESLAVETAPLGIHVTLVEPGPFRTDWAGRSIVESPTRIADYDATAGVRRTQTRERSGNQAGDPVRGAAAIIAAIESAEPPLRLLLGAPALELAYKKLDTMRANFDAWKDTTLGADYPEHQRKG